MTRLVTCICILTVAASCILAKSLVADKDKSKPSPAPTRPAVKSRHKPDIITVFLTGNELGMLQPCGCSGGQLGGLDRRGAIFDTVGPSRRLIVNTGLFVESDSPQNLIKFDIIIEAFRLLGYDLVNLTEKDIEIAQNLGAVSELSSALNIISSHRHPDVNLPAKFTKQFLLTNKAKTLSVTVAAFDAKSAPIDQVAVLFPSTPGQQTVNILILNRCEAEIIDSIAKMQIVDCLICPAESDEPALISEANKRPLVVSVGRYGKYVGKLEIASAKADCKPALTFSAVPVTENLQPKKALVELYKDYQMIVKDARLLENRPRFSLPNGLEYAGSISCKSCHRYEYKKWTTSPHAHAYATLEKVGSQFDPECVLCHVVGAEYDSGFVSPRQTCQFKNVGCEVCHGPGSNHIRTSGKSRTTGPWADCSDCHTPERSADYAGNEQQYFDQIIHWREPNIADNVKKGKDSKD